MNFQIFKLDLEKAEEPEIKLPTSVGSLKKKLSSRKTSAAATAKSLQSCLTLCNPIDGSPPGSAIPGIPQARTLEMNISATYDTGRKSMFRRWLISDPDLRRLSSLEAGKNLLPSTDE